MTRFTNNRFFGIAPRIPARSLADGMAQVVENADLSVPVKLRPLHGDRFVQTLSAMSGGVNALYLYEKQYWFEFSDGDTDVVKGPLAEDATKRVYISDSQYPRVTRNDLAISVSGVMPAASYRLGVPAPVSAPATVVNGTGDPDNPYFTSYVQTYVTSWGEEGPPGEPSPVISVDAGQTVDVSLIQPPAGAYSWALIRIYRLNTGSSGSDFQFVAEVPVGTATYTDATASDELAEVIPSVTWEPPPDENYPTGPLRGLIALPNGSLAGFTGPTLCISEPYLPHAWPFDNRYPIDRDIVAIGRVPYGVVLLTDAVPYLASGTDPSAISISPLSESQACLSKRSVVDMGGYLLYASPEGLVAVDGSTVKVVTATMFEEDDWRARFNPASISGFYWENKYVGFYDNGTEQAGFIFNPGDETASFVPLTLYATAGYYDTGTDQLYLNVDGDLKVFSHPDEPERSYTWHSRDFRSAAPVPMAAVRIIGDGSVTMEVFADGESVLVEPLLLSVSDTIRLPSGYRAKEWSVKLTGIGSVEQIDLVTSVRELEQ